MKSLTAAMGCGLVLFALPALAQQAETPWTLNLSNRGSAQLSYTSGQFLAPLEIEFRCMPTEMWLEQSFEEYGGVGAIGINDEPLMSSAPVRFDGLVQERSMSSIGLSRGIHLDHETALRAILDVRRVQNVQNAAGFVSDDWKGGLWEWGAPVSHGGERSVWSASVDATGFRDLSARFLDHCLSAANS